MGFVGDGLIVDVQQTGIEAIADRGRAPEIRREHAGREAVLVLIGKLYRLVVAGDRVIATTAPSLLGFLLLYASVRDNQGAPDRKQTDAEAV